MADDVLTCEQVLKRVLEFVDRELSADDERRLQQHLDTCRSCYSRVEFERRLKGRLGELPEETAEPAFEARISKLIKGF